MSATFAVFEDLDFAWAGFAVFVGRLDFFGQGAPEHEQFPDVLIARFFAFKAAELLQFSDAEKADVDLKQLFS